MVLDFVPMAEEHLAAAAGLLAARHREDRAVAPILPARFEALADAASVLGDAMGQAGLAGY